MNQPYPWLLYADVGPNVGASARLQAPAQAAIGACGRRFLRQERLAEIAIGLASPDFPQSLLGGVAKRIVFVTALRERGDTAGQRPAVGGNVHDRPRPAAQRPRRAMVVTLQTHSRLGRSAGCAESNPQRSGECSSAIDMGRLLMRQPVVERLVGP